MKKIKLGDICKINLNSYSVANDNYKFVNYLDTSNITQNEIAAIQKINLESEILPSRAKRKVKTDSIIYSTVRPNQKHFGIIKSQPKNFLVSTGFAVIDVIPEKIDANFLFYQLSQEKIIQHLQSIAEQSMTSYPAIRPDDLKNLEIDLPPLEVQKQIGNFLYSLDQKISLNKKINATLEDMAKTIFLHKFFRKPTNGKISDILVENEKSAISVGEAKNSGGDFPFFTSGENILRWNEKLVDGRNIFLNDGGNVGIKFYVGAAAYSTHTYCITAKDNFADFLYLTLKIFESEIEKRFFTGTGLKNLRKDLLKDFAIYIPTQAELKNFNFQPCFDTISKNFRENNLLENLRDFLLPLLMNGQVSFKEKI